MHDSRLVAERYTYADDAAEARGYYRMFVCDLTLPCNIGVYPHERRGPQRVRLNLDLQVREGPAPLEDDIGNVLSYEEVVDDIRALLSGGHINLVETLAEKVAELCLRREPVVWARVRVEKLDVVPDAASVGVEIERHAVVQPSGNVYPLDAGYRGDAPRDD